MLISLRGARPRDGRPPEIGAGRLVVPLRPEENDRGAQGEDACVLGEID